MPDRPDMFRVDKPLQSVLSLAANPDDQEHAIAVMLGGNVATLTAQEALDMLQWLYEQRDALIMLTRQMPVQSEPGEA